MERADLLELLDNYMDPSGLDYQEWLQIGMALKQLLRALHLVLEELED